MNKLLKKRILNDFISAVAKDQEVFAPVKTDIVRFEKVTDASKIYLKENTYYPPKYFFFVKKEILFNFNKNKIITPKLRVKKFILFGIRKCDLNSIMKQDMVFLDENQDSYYKKRRDASLLIGYHCKEPGNEYCFCESMDLNDFYDIMFYDLNKKEFLIEVGSEKGKKFIKKYNRFFKPTNIVLKPEDKKIKSQKKLEKEDIADLYDHPDWQKGASICFSCSVCNLVCPSCYCFNINDELDINTDKGKRVRTHAACQLKSFTRVAGNYFFRGDRLDRFKHRIYHQLSYFKEKYGINLCSGCGRCISYCPTRIDFVKIINEMK